MNAGETGTGRSPATWSRTNPNVRTVCADPAIGTFVDDLLGIAVNGLPRMFRSDRRTFAFTQRRTPDGGTELVGESVRYGAIALLGIGCLGESLQRRILGGDTAASFCGHLIDRLGDIDNLGDVALVAWVAAELGHSDLDRAMERLETIDEGGPCETVHAAWVVSALTAASAYLDTGDAAHGAVARLLGGSATPADVFGHYTDSSVGSPIRRHVACFADQVYPIQALARHARVFGDDGSLRIAGTCAARICEVMGEKGQWWWHYDTRTGSVVEGYPVYSVHQDSMAPMALLDLAEAGGELHTEAIRSGLLWLAASPEIGGSLVDEEEGIIWRKVGRREPAKLVRAVRAATTRIRPGTRLGALDTLFPAGTVDEESRPYHLGWILRAWMRGDA